MYHSDGMKIKSEKVVGDWTLTKTIGKGSMGKVKLAINNLTNEKRACKIIAIENINHSPIGPTTSIRDIPNLNIHEKFNKNDKPKEFRIVREAAIMLLLDHPHIVTLYEIHMIEHYFYFIFDLINGGQMLDFIISHGKLKEKIARKYLRQIISAVDYCHMNSIVHRDLKIENILIDNEGSIKLIDFGLSNLYQPNSLLSTHCGSLYFAAPELLSAKSYVGPEIDIWSLGVILYVLVVGKVPFDDNNTAVLHQLIISGTVDYPNYISTELKSLIGMMLNPNPTLRCTMEEIKFNSWLLKGYDGPPENYLPPRQPIEFPVNPEVVKRMQGFGFGSDGEITADITDFIQKRNLLGNNTTTVEKKQQKETVHHQQRGDDATAQNAQQTASKKDKFFKNNVEKMEKLKETIGRAIHRSEKGGKNCLPESSVLSIYYLVMEKMDREKNRLETLRIKSGIHTAGIPINGNINLKVDVGGPSVSEMASPAFLNRIGYLPYLEYASDMEGNRPARDSDEDYGNNDVLSAPSSPTMSKSNLIFIGCDQQPKRRTRPRAASMGDLRIKKGLNDIKQTFKKKRKSTTPPSISGSPSTTGSLPLHKQFDNEKLKKDTSKRSFDGQPPFFTQRSTADQLGAVTGSESEQEHSSLRSNLVSAVKKKFSQFGNAGGGGNSQKPFSGRLSSEQSASELSSQHLNHHQQQREMTSDIEDAAISSSRAHNIKPLLRQSKKQFSLNRFKNESPSTPEFDNASSPTQNDIDPASRDITQTIGTRDNYRSQMSRKAKLTKRLSGIQFRPNSGGRSATNLLTTDQHPFNLSEPSQQSNHNKTRQNKVLEDPQRADSNLKNVFLKNLFSVVTSSTKSSHTIRKELIRVFEELNIEYTESAGFFGCKFETPTSLEQTNPAIALPIGDITPLLHTPSLVDDRNILTASSDDEEVDFPLFRPDFDKEDVGGSSSSAAAPGFLATNENPREGFENRRTNSKILVENFDKLAIGSNIDAMDTAGVGDIVDSGGEVEERGVEKRMSPLAKKRASLKAGFMRPQKRGRGSTVHFEVYIVKIGWIGLNGVRFRRISGNSWQYKNICNDILDKARL